MPSLEILVQYMVTHNKLTKSQKQHIHRHLVRKEALITLLILISFGLLVYEWLWDPSRHWLIAIDVYEIVLGCILVFEFFIELGHAKSRQKYWRQNWLFLLASIPIPMTMFEIFRGVRLVRLLRFAKAFEHIDYEYNSWLLIVGKKTR